MGGVTGPEKHPVAAYNKLFRIETSWARIAIHEDARAFWCAIGAPELPPGKTPIGR
jgi:hypothetical protein